jgi:serine-type D-Ala-D-Ala carboxypeptidase/endopeptidase (penicillin-binding protein 4)
MFGNGVTRRWAIGALMAGVASPALAKSHKITHHAPKVVKPKPPEILAPDALINTADLGGKVAYLVVDAKSGRVLESANADAPMAPASVAKTLTTLYALEALGGNYRFTTRLVATAPLSGGVVQGDLVLVGGGDPTLDTDALGDMAKQLAAAGVRGVSGRFLIDASALPAISTIDPGQPPQVEYNPGLSGLNLNFNRVYFGWQKKGVGYVLTMDARGERYAPVVSRARMQVVNRGDPEFDYVSRDGVEQWSVAERALGSHGSRWLPVRQTGAYAGDVFRTLAAAQGIKLPEAQAVSGTSGGTVLAQHQSAALRIVLREMLKYSTNVTAEVVGLTASIALGGQVDTLEASARRMNDWAVQRFGIHPQLVDHSGLMPTNQVTVADLVTLLRAGGTDDLRGILKTVPMQDERGHYGTAEAPKVQAKSGTLNFVSNLAGYETTAKGHELVFAMLAGDVARCEAVPQADRENPYGVRSWVWRAHVMQRGFLERWARVYDA